MTSRERFIPDRLQSPLQSRIKSWETLLLAVAIGIFVANSIASPYFLNAWNLSDATFNFTEKAMIAFAMALLIIAGEIDLSVASIIALASTAMGAAAQIGAETPILVLVGLGTGLICGAFNGKKGCPSHGNKCPQKAKHVCAYVIRNDGSICGDRNHGFSEHNW